MAYIWESRGPGRLAAQYLTKWFSRLLVSVRRRVGIQTFQFIIDSLCKNVFEFRISWGYTVQVGCLVGDGKCEYIPMIAWNDGFISVLHLNFTMHVNVFCHCFVPISFRVTSLALGQSYDCPSACEATLKNMSKLITWSQRTDDIVAIKQNTKLCTYLIGHTLSWFGGP